MDRRKPVKKTVTPQAKPAPRRRGPRAVAKPAASKPAQATEPAVRTDKRAPAYQGKGSKAGAFADHAEQLGWTVQRVRNGDGSKTVHCQRDLPNGMAELVVAYWTAKEAFNHEYTVHAVHVREDTAPTGKTIVNAATGYRHLQATPAEVLAAKQPRKRGSAPASTRRTARLPFDPATADDDTVLAAVKGHQIWWKNEFDPERLESAAVPANSKSPTTITLSQADGKNYGRRMINFCDHPDEHLNPHGTGYRSAFVDQLVRVK